MVTIMLLVMITNMVTFTRMVMITGTTITATNMPIPMTIITGLAPLASPSQA